MEEQELFRPLDWDSQFFGLNIARLLASYLDKDLVRQTVNWSQSNDIDCLYFLCGTDDAATIRLAEDNGFRLVDIRITFDRRLPDGAGIESVKEGHGIIRTHRPEDVPALRTIAAASHHDSRFYFDPNFARAKCDALYETWIEKSCNGYADIVFVADIDDNAEGYISCHLMPGEQGQIGLVGIASGSQGKGLGGRLVNTALRWFSEQGTSHVTVVTQGRNANAQRLYQRSGFVTRETQLWYHRWIHRQGNAVV